MERELRETKAALEISLEEGKSRDGNVLKVSH
jgi:hypothetical protein